MKMGEILRNVKHITIYRREGLIIQIRKLSVIEETSEQKKRSPDRNLYAKKQFVLPINVDDKIQIKSCIRCSFNY